MSAKADHCPSCGAPLGGSDSIPRGIVHGTVAALLLVAALLGFLRDVCEPYLRIFRRFIPMIGPLDISPIVALVVLQIVGNLVVNAVHG